MTSPARPPLYLVDDDEAVLDSLRFMLESCDERQLFSFSDGERFLAEVDLHQPACLILDCRMPGLSGPEVQQRLKAAQSPIAILFLTGHGEVPGEWLKRINAESFFQVESRRSSASS